MLSRVTAGAAAAALAVVPWLGLLAAPMSRLLMVCAAAVVVLFLSVVLARGADPLTARSHTALVARRLLAVSVASCVIVVAASAVLALVFGPHWWPVTLLSVGLVVVAGGLRAFLVNHYPHPGIDYE